MKKWQKFCTSILVLSALTLALVGCGKGNASSSDTTTSSSKSAGKDTIKMIFYPNESASEFDKSREALKEVIQKATGKNVELVTTTDYNIVIESIASGQADLAMMGGEGYIEANKKNDKVQAILTNSGESGTLEDAIYYSFIAVKEENAAKYQEGSGYTIKPIKGQTFSFVSNSSTSGFKVPSSAIIKEFGLKSSDDLIIDGTFFKKVLFGGTHQGSAVNVLKGDAAAGAFMNQPNYFDCISGEENKAGMVYQVKKDAAAPFDTVRGEKARIILSTPVLNGPMVANTETLTSEDVKKIQDAMSSDEVSNNEALFAAKDSGKIALFEKKGDSKFVPVTDSFYDPIRELAN